MAMDYRATQQSVVEGAAALRAYHTFSGGRTP
jgi:hypothetical protein